MSPPRDARILDAYLIPDGTMKMTAKLALLALLAAGCANADAANWGGSVTDSAGVSIVSNPAEGNWSLVPEPTITKDLDIGAIEGDAAYQFGSIAAIDVNDLGEILVLDQQAAEVRVFDAAGMYLRTVGRPGAGPGGLMPGPTLMGLRAGRGDTVYVVDMQRFRIVGFAGDGTEIGSYEMALTQGIPVAFRPAPNGRLAVQVRRMVLPGMTDSTAASGDLIIIRDITAGTADTVARLQSGESFSFGNNSMQLRVFASEPLWTILGDGRLIRGRNDVFRLETYTPDGVVTAVIKKALDKVAVSQTHRQSYLRLLRMVFEARFAATPIPAEQRAGLLDRLMNSVTFGEHFPAYANLMEGPGNTLWVQRHLTAIPDLPDGEMLDETALMQSREWDVFDAAGRLLGRLDLPERFTPMRATATAVYGVQRDEDDVQHVVRLVLQ